tara:strand:- start:276 stop:449 length:174 start_codon:yes stop_codon:yes gene_type:complete
MSTPNQPSVKYMAALYQTEDICRQAKESYMQAFEAKSQEYKDKAKRTPFVCPLILSL